MKQLEGCRRIVEINGSIYAQIYLDQEWKCVSSDGLQATTIESAATTQHVYTFPSAEPAEMTLTTYTKTFISPPKVIRSDHELIHA